MNTMLLTLMLCAAAPELKQPAAPSSSAEAYGQWRIELLVGRQAALSSAVHWAGGTDAPQLQVGVERNLGDVVPVLAGLGVQGGAGTTLRSGLVGLTHTELWFGASYQFPHDGLWDVVFPYVRADVLLGWGYLRGTQSDGSIFTPGLSVRLGFRVMLPRMGGRARLYGLFDGGAQYRASANPQLQGHSTLPQPPREPGTPLGALDLTGYDLRWGAGIEW